MRTEEEQYCNQILVEINRGKPPLVDVEGSRSLIEPIRFFEYLSEAIGDEVSGRAP